MEHPVFLTFVDRGDYRRMLRAIRKTKNGKKHLTAWGSNTIQLTFASKEEAEYFQSLINDDKGENKEYTHYNSSGIDNGNTGLHGS